MQIESSGKPGFCLTGNIYFIHPPNVTKCEFGNGDFRAFVLTERGEIVASQFCITENGVNNTVTYTNCDTHFKQNATATQKFTYDRMVRLTHTLMHKTARI